MIHLSFMNTKFKILRSIPVIGLGLFIACSPSEEIEIIGDSIQNTEENQSISNPISEDDLNNLPEGLEVFSPTAVDANLILVNDAAANRVYLMNKLAQIQHEWDLGNYRLGNDAELLPDGRLLAMLESENPLITLGGFGGLLALFSSNGDLEWSYEYSNNHQIAHHDLLMLPNGNILFMTWEKKTKDQADAIGYELGTEIIYDALKEINPTTNEIVWEWHMWDHLVQNIDESKANFGTIKNPLKIDINYVTNPDLPGDVSHCNGIAYDVQKDLIYLSANFYSEIWVIDHSTNSNEAKTSQGGNYGVGGDLVYRFGNPETYKDLESPRLFDRNHHPNLMTNNGDRHIFVYSNGNSNNQSKAYELKLPQVYNPNVLHQELPTVVWSYTHPDLFSGKVSGVVPLTNGNRLITEGDFGFWEVNINGDLIWRYHTQGFFWRGYSISPNILDILIR